MFLFPSILSTAWVWTHSQQPSAQQEKAGVRRDRWKREGGESRVVSETEEGGATDSVHPQAVPGLGCPPSPVCPWSQPYHKQTHRTAWRNVTNIIDLLL